MTPNCKTNIAARPWRRSIRQLMSARGRHSCWKTISNPSAAIRVFRKRCAVTRRKKRIDKIAARFEPRFAKILEREKKRSDFLLACRRHSIMRQPGQHHAEPDECADES